ncbi:hypothetical protein TWF718_007923 [Orbilia javanica]|uniref:Uncharacterized protein n=1 Tax=Orbilia javanica TaxID=47235 RepID=A0AAN8RH97_9PEZI
MRKPLQLTPKRPRTMGEGEPSNQGVQWDSRADYDAGSFQTEVFICNTWSTMAQRTLALPREPGNSGRGPQTRKRAREVLADDSILGERRVQEIEGISNPFCSLVGTQLRHPRTLALSRTEYSRKLVPTDGLLKFGRMRELDKNVQRTPNPPHKSAREPNTTYSVVSSTSISLTNQANRPLPGLRERIFLGPLNPAYELSPLDKRLWMFYINAFCPGRTLLDEQNFHSFEIVPMARGSDGVLHAVLALAASYLLDYHQNDELRAIADHHYARSVQCVTRELKNAGNEEALVAILSLLIHNDIICCGSSPTGKTPAWYKAVLLAKKVLDRSDPGYGSGRPENVQESNARRRINNEVAFCEILSSVFAPIGEVYLVEECPYTWLWRGNERKLTRIEGNTGMCPKVLFILGQITYVAGKHAKEPRSNVWLNVGNKLRGRLESTRQWSELSNGYPDAKKLLDSCILDENGFVRTKEEVTDLIAESYVRAALIYLECRLFRRSPYDQVVKKHLRILIDCFDKCPTHGDLYTAQTPVFGVAMAGVVATNDREREFCRKYIRGTCTTGERGNLSTLGNTLEFIWGWMDGRLGSLGGEDYIPHPWWEDLVTAFEEAKGRRDFA